MREIGVPFKCSCGLTLMFDALIEESSERRTYEHPGCAAVWCAMDGVECPCGSIYTPEGLQNDAEINEEVQRREAEPYYDE